MATISTYYNASAQPRGLMLERMKFIISDLTCNAGDVITLGILKKGMRVIDVIVAFEGTGSSTLSVGDDGSATRYINAASTASTGILRASVAAALSAAGAAGVEAAGPGFRDSANDRTLQMTVAGAGVSGKDYVVIFIVENSLDAN